LSVPEPDISLHFLIQRLKILNQAPNKLIQRLTGDLFRLPVQQHFSRTRIGLVVFSNSRAKSQAKLDRLAVLGVLAFRVRYQPQPKRTCKNEPESRFTAKGTRGRLPCAADGRWRLPG
jgi:hypothetical protein